MIELFVTVPAAAPNDIPPGVVAAPPILPLTTVDPFSPDIPFLLIAPILVPKAFANDEVTSTIKASIKTCFVLTSISSKTFAMTSKSSLCPLTIIDLVVSSIVIFRLDITLAPSAPCVANKSSKVVFASVGLM